MKKHYIALLLFMLSCCTLYSQAKTYTLQELRSQFTHKGYTEKALLDFQKTMAGLREKPQLHEDIPGQVISWFTLNDQFSWHKTYLVQNDKVKEVATLPSDEGFLQKLNSYVPEKSRFSYSSDLWSFALADKQLKDHFYLIKATAKSFNSHPEIPNDAILTYELEYKTKDFKKFVLVRLKDIHSNDWIEVAPY